MTVGILPFVVIAQALTPTPMPLEAEVLERARTFAGTQNSDWTPLEHDVDGVAMVLVPVGCFMMGRDDGYDQQPVHEQCFDAPFWIGKYEVTNAEYRLFIEAGGYDTQAYWTEAGWAARQSNDWVAPEHWQDAQFNGEHQPVVGVSWYEAQAYATWRGMTLASEAQWEYATRGIEAWLYAWGNAFVADNAVYGEVFDSPLDVGSHPSGASWVGAFDTAGNVWEWTSSQYMGYPYVADDGRENAEGASIRVMRGGAFIDSANNVTSVVRDFASPPDFRNHALGFRVVFVHGVP